PGRVPAPLLLPLHPLPRQGHDAGDRGRPLPRDQEAPAAGGDGGVLRDPRDAGPQEEALDLRAPRLAQAPARRGHPARGAALRGPPGRDPAALRGAPQERAGRPPLRAAHLPAAPRPLVLFDFFFTVRKAGVPASVNEFLT